jgi:intracellular septation protein
MWKPTVINVLLAVALLCSEWFMKISLMTRMLHKMAPFPASVCATLTYLWAGFFVFLGLLNLYIAYNFSEATWVNFKLFGMMGLSLLFMVGQGFYLAKHMPKTALSDH